MLNRKKNTQSIFTRVRNKRDFPLSPPLLNIVFEAHARDISNKKKEITDRQTGREVSIFCLADDIILNHIASAGILNANSQRGASVPVLTEFISCKPNQTNQRNKRNNTTTPNVYCVQQ